MSSAGRFEVKVWNPYPCWLLLFADGEEVARIDHRELSDLQYALAKAAQEVRGKLPRESWHEVGPAPDGGERG